MPCALLRSLLCCGGAAFLKNPKGFEHFSVEAWGYIAEMEVNLFVESPALPAFCDALRNCKSLKTLALNGVELWDDMVVAGQLILAMVELPVLQEVSLCRNSMDETPDQRAVGECQRAWRYLSW